ncbi:MAG: NHL repeat-containing protein [Candidatus Zhuqueibacterota bacterium]
MKKNLFALLLFFIILSQFFCSEYKDIPCIKPEPILTLGKLDDKHEAFHQVKGVLVDSESNIYVLDSGNNRIVKFNKDGHFLLEFGRSGQGPGEFIHPTAFDIDSCNQIYVLDGSNYRVQIFDHNGNIVREFKPRGIDFGSSATLRLDSMGNIYFNYPYKGKLIDVYSNDGHYLKSIGDYIYSGDKRRAKKMNITFFDLDKDDNMYVLFLSYPVVRKYDRNHNLIYEKDISNIPEVQESMKNQNERIKTMPQATTGIFGGIGVTLNGDHIVHSGRFYRFDTNGKPVQKLELFAYKMSIESDQFIFCVYPNDEQGWIVEKYPLPKL